MSGSEPDGEAVREAILALTAARGPWGSVCPSEVARGLRPEGWRALMPVVRAAASELASGGRIVVTQGSRTVDPARVRGPIRLRARGGD